MQFKVGRAGIPEKAKGSLAACEGIRSLGLDSMEIEFVHGIYMNHSVAEKFGEQAKKYNVTLTIHAPFFINLNSKDEKVIDASKKRILDTAERGEKAGAFSCTFHPGYRHGAADGDAYALFKERLKDVMSEAKKTIRIAPETTGKDAQFGSWEELLKLHQEIGCGVCFDFSHIWAREKGKIDFEDTIKKIRRDYKWYKDMHIHLSGIRYGAKGELNHQSFDETQFPWKKVLSLLIEKGFGGVIICENPSPTSGALQIQEFLRKL